MPQRRVVSGEKSGERRRRGHIYTGERETDIVLKSDGIFFVASLILQLIYEIGVGTRQLGWSATCRHKRGLGMMRGKYVRDWRLLVCYKRMVINSGSFKG